MHPNFKEIKKSRTAKHHMLGIQGEHPETKAERIACTRKERDKVKPAEMPHPETLKDH
jgi:hypothetical protein